MSILWPGLEWRDQWKVGVPNQGPGIGYGRDAVLPDGATLQPMLQRYYPDSACPPALSVSVSHVPYLAIERSKSSPLEHVHEPFGTNATTLLLGALFVVKLDASKPSRQR